MAHKWLLMPRALAFTVVILLLAAAVACGGDEAPTATPTSGPQDGGPQATPTPTELSPVLTITQEAPPTPIFRPTDTPVSGTSPAPTAAPTPTTAPPPASVVQKGGVIPMQAYANVPSRDIWTFGSPLNRFMSPVFSNLIEFNPETRDINDVRCDLCESWELDPDGVTYTFRLRDNARFHDGTPITSEDVFYSLDNMWHPDNYPHIWEDRDRKPTAQIWHEHLVEDGLRVIDGKTIEMVTSDTLPDFIPGLALDIWLMASKKTIEELGRPHHPSEWKLFNGSGPYTVADNVRDVSYNFRRNEDYFKEGYPYNDGMDLNIITDSNTAIAAYRTQQILMHNGSSSNLSTQQTLQLVEDNDFLDVHLRGPGAFFGLMFNYKQKPFDNPKVRQAIYLALWRQPIIATLHKGHGYLGTPFAPGTWYGPNIEDAEQMPGFRQWENPDTGQMEKHPEDIAEAKRLLAEAGFENGFETEISARIALQYVDFAILVAEQLKEYLNIDAEVRQLEAAAGFDAFQRGDFHTAAQAWGYSFHSPTAAFSWYRTGGTLHMWQGYDELTELEEIYQKQVRELDIEQRRAYVLEANDFMMRDGNATSAGVWWRVTLYLYNTIIQNYFPGTDQVQFRYEHLWCDPAPCGS